MASRVQSFADNAKLNALKEKLAELGVCATGNKAALKLRLLETVRSLSREDLEEYFPVVPLPDDTDDVDDADDASENTVGNDHVDEERNATSEMNDDDALDAELQVLRGRLDKKREIAKLKRQLSELSIETSSKPYVSFRDVEESLIRFSGDDSYSVQRWMQQFEESAEVLGWDSRTKLIYAKRLMVGTARYFLRTANFTSWDDFKRALKAEFASKVTSAEIHNQLRNRKKRKEETLQQYVFSMVEIASLTPIEETDLIDYIINGISDSTVNKMLLYSANSLGELKQVLRKYDKMKSQFSQESHKQSKRLTVDSSSSSAPRQLKCFNCNQLGHISTHCTKPKRDRNTCFRCGKTGHRSRECSITPQQQQVLAVFDSEGPDRVVEEQQERLSHEYAINPVTNNFEYSLDYSLGGSEPEIFTCTLRTLLDSGSVISFVQEQFVPSFLVSSVSSDTCKFRGINGSSLRVVGVIYSQVNFKNKNISLSLYVVQKNSMNYPVILGRDFIEKCNLELAVREKENASVCNACELNQQDFVGDLGQSRMEDGFQEISNIDTSDKSQEISLNINDGLPFETKSKVFDIVRPACVLDNNNNTEEDTNQFEMVIKLTKEEPFFCTPRRLPYAQKLQLDKILKDLLQRGIIRESSSPYASPIVLVNKKNRKLRLCVDYRQLNKFTVRDNYPLPIIEDLLDRLGDKRYFTTIDLRSGFHHIKIAPDSVKYTSFVTPLGQFEYLRMPFGLKNAPSVFQRYLKGIFKDLIAQDRLLIYMDDLLIASKTIENHLETYRDVMIKKNHSN